MVLSEDEAVSGRAEAVVVDICQTSRTRCSVPRKGPIAQGQSSSPPTVTRLFRSKRRRNQVQAVSCAA